MDRLVRGCLGNTGQNDIKLGIMKATPSEVMVAIVAKVDRVETVFAEEVLEKLGPLNILWVAVGVSSNKDGAVVGGGDIKQESIKQGKRGDKVWVPPCSWEIQTYVDRTGEARNFY